MRTTSAIKGSNFLRSHAVAGSQPRVRNAVSLSMLLRSEHLAQAWKDRMTLVVVSVGGLIYTGMGGVFHLEGDLAEVGYILRERVCACTFLPAKVSREEAQLGWG